MRKPDALRAFLAGTVRGLADNPDRLHIFIDQGRIAKTGTPSPSFEYRYRLNVILTDFGASPDTVMVPLLVWIASEQPQLLDADGHEPFRFEADILDNSKVDLSIELELSEVVVVTPRAGGGFDVTHPPEPAYDAPFEDLPDPTMLWRIDLGDETLLPPIAP